MNCRLTRNSKKIVSATDFKIVHQSGFAPQFHWTDYLGGKGAWNPEQSGPAIGLDLNSADDSFVAMVSDSLACLNLDPNLGDDTSLYVAHGVGHLFGAGHDREASAPGQPAPSPVGRYLMNDSHSNVVVTTFFGITLRFKRAVARTDSQINTCAQNFCFQSQSYIASAFFQPEDLWLTQHFVDWDDSCPAATDYYTGV